jgi:hypothetical protein
LGLNDESYAHRFARERAPYLREVFQRTKPEALVVVSRNPETYKARYSSDAFVLRELARGYRLVHRELSPVESYHYFVYARPGVTLHGVRLGPEVSSPLQATSAVEAASLALR